MTMRPGFLRDECAAVSVMLVGFLTVMILSLALALDAARLYLLQSRLDAALYIGALAGGATAQFILVAEDAEQFTETGQGKVKIMNMDEIEDAAQRFFGNNIPPDFMDARIEGPVIVEDATQGSLSIRASASWMGLLGRILGRGETRLEAERFIIRHGADMPRLKGKIRLR